MRMVSGGLVAMVLGLMLGLVSCQQQETSPGADRAQPATAGVPKEPASEGVIVAMGDSLTAGLGVPEDEAYPAQLQRVLQAEGYRFRVINAGISGETSSGALSRTQWTLTLKPDIVILETGANDGLRAIDPDLTRKNILAIVEQFKQRQVVVVLAGMRMVENLGEAYTTQFAKIYPDVAAAHDLIFMPFFLDGVAGDPALNQPDGIHPTAPGYRKIVAELVPYVTAAIERVRQNHRPPPG